MKQTNFPSARAETAPKTLFGVSQRVFQKIRQAIRAVMRPVCRFLQARREPARAALTAELAAEAESADWHTRDVLVGSLGSQAQLADNLRRNYYYVPARVLPEQEVPIRYIALYQSRNLFGPEAGIRYYGRVSCRRPVARGQIGFPLTHNNPGELYVAFRVEGWRTLPAPVEIRDQGVSAPKFTTLFLLAHCTQSFELFQIRSAADFRLMAAIRCALQQSHQKFFIDTHHTLTAGRDAFLLRDARGALLGKVPMDSYHRSPSSTFRQLREMVLNTSTRQETTL